MTLTRKFSQFISGGNITPTDEPVGLEAGVNTIWTGAGSGGGGVTQQLPQPTPPVSVGQWLKVTPTSGLYTGAQGDNASDAEVIGLVVLADATNFTLQQSGYVTSAMAVVSGLTAGMGYFISTANPGVMVPTDAVVNGQVSRPVFVADSADSGWIVPYRGMIVGGPAPSGSGGGGFNLTWNVLNNPGAYVATSNNGYIVTANALVNITLPTSFAVGDVIIIYNYATSPGQYEVDTQAGQSIRFANITSATSITSTLIGDSLTLIGLVPSTVMGVTAASGNQVVI